MQSQSDHVMPQSTFLWWAPKNASIFKQTVNDCSRSLRSSKVIDFVTNRKGICNFLFCPISEMVHVFSWKPPSHPYAAIKLRMFPLDEIADLGIPSSKDSRLNIMKLLSK